MSLSKAMTHIRHEITVGRHLHECFADQNTRREGWKRIQAARRLQRRLKMANLID